jgi:hypothetical protein
MLKLLHSLCYLFPCYETSYLGEIEVILLYIVSNWPSGHCSRSALELYLGEPDSYLGKVTGYPE